MVGLHFCFFSPGLLIYCPTSIFHPVSFLDSWLKIGLPSSILFFLLFWFLAECWTSIFHLVFFFLDSWLKIGAPSSILPSCFSSPWIHVSVLVFRLSFNFPSPLIHGKFWTSSRFWIQDPSLYLFVLCHFSLLFQSKQIKAGLDMRHI